MLEVYFFVTKKMLLLLLEEEEEEEEEAPIDWKQVFADLHLLLFVVVSGSLFLEHFAKKDQ